ncbi:hypothetical protein ACWJW2_19595 [Clostridioides difficile]
MRRTKHEGDEMSNPASNAVPDEQGEATNQPHPPDSGGDFKNDDSKNAVLADLAKERDKRKALEDRFNKLAAALGVDQKASKDADLSEKVADLTTRLDVSELARRHGITDEDDCAALAAVTDSQARAKLAARLAPQKGAEKGEEPDDATVFPRPKPDASQGSKGAPPKPEPLPGRDRLVAGIEAALGKK